MNKNILKSKKFIIPLVLALLILVTYIYSQKDVITVPAGNINGWPFLMNDGRVLILSFNLEKQDNAYHYFTKIYDPKTGKLKYIGTVGEISALITHKDILLPNNQILLVGIEDSTKSVRNPNIANSEILDPVANKFITIGHMQYHKFNPTLILLPNGKVLITGCKAELYDPKIRKFILSYIMAHPIDGSALQLNNGNVLIYGYTPSLTEEAGIYDYKKNKFKSIYIAPPSSNYIINNALALNNGKALLLGMDNSKFPVVEVYNPKANNIHQIKDMNIPRIFPKMVLLNDGKVLILGGEGRHFINLNTSQRMGHVDRAEIFDPKTETFSLTGKMNRIGSLDEFRGGYTTTLLPSGKVLIVEGEIGEGLAERPINDLEIYDPKTGIFTRKKRRYSGSGTTLLKDGRVLITGGTDWFGYHRAEIYNPNDNN